MHPEPPVEILPIQIQPLQMVIHRGGTMVVANREGWVDGGRTGIFDHDTRYVSRYQVSFEGLPPVFLGAQRATYDCAFLSYTNPRFRAGSVVVDDLELSLRIVRSLQSGYHECFEITNFHCTPVVFRFLVNLESAFDTVFEVRALRRTPPRLIREHWDEAVQTLSCSYRDTWFWREARYRILAADSRPTYAPSLLIFRVHLAHAQTWRAEVSLELDGGPRTTPGSRASPSAGERATTNRTRLGTTERDSRSRSPGDSDDSVTTALLTSVQSGGGLAGAFQRSAEDLSHWASTLTQLECPNPTVQRAYRQAVRDLASLRFQKVGDEWYPAAGVPWYNAIFGRDALVTALQCLPIGCPFPRAVLARLAELQGRRVCAWNDEEPGKIPHELRVGQFSIMGRIPFHPFYGTVDASLLYVILLSETYRFTGDRQLLETFIEPLDRCLSWARTYGDIDGDGFIEYWLHSPHDYHNQAWKDSGDAVVYPDGRIVPDPIAIVEVQGYYYDALRRAAEIYRILGRGTDAEAVEGQSARLFRDFDAAFWLPEEGFYAFGLDPDKRAISSAASNPGQLFWSGIVASNRADAVVQRLFAPDLFCGWGIRTLSSRNAAYDPFSYQRGSVWPHDNAIIALGLKRYGYWEAANRIAEGIFSASGYFADGQLPELWVGLDRDDTLWPILYPKANAPQAWAAGSVPLLLRAILGLEPDPTNRRLLFDPTLPDWLEELRLVGLRYLGESLDVRITGGGRSSRVEVLRGRGVAVEQGPALPSHRPESE